MTRGLANHLGRAVLWEDGAGLDVERASGGSFGPGPMEVLAQWDAFREWVAGASGAGDPISARELGPAVPEPRKVFAIGLNFGPLGPALVAADSVADPGDLAISCDVAGERMQESRTSQLVFGVPELVSRLSRYCPLEPGYVIFTGTPGGVGSVREPRRYLRAGEEIVTVIEGLGALRNRCVEPPAGDASSR